MVPLANGRLEISCAARIVSAGFKVNERKTRMFLRCSRQSVTGLVVNAKPNICELLPIRPFDVQCCLSVGEYYRPSNDGAEMSTNNLNPLEGMLSHIYFVKARRDRSKEMNRLANSYHLLHRRSCIGGSCSINTLWHLEPHLLSLRDHLTLPICTARCAPSPTVFQV